MSDFYRASDHIEARAKWVGERARQMQAEAVAEDGGPKRKTLRRRERIATAVLCELTPMADGKGDIPELDPALAQRAARMALVYADALIAALEGTKG